MTSVWPALWPPRKRTTMSARSDSQSTILPLPSSPHWAPITATLAIVLPSDRLRPVAVQEMGAAEPAGLGARIGRRRQAGNRAPALAAQRLGCRRRGAGRQVEPLFRLRLRQRTGERIHVEREAGRALAGFQRIAAAATELAAHALGEHRQ